MKYLLWLLLLTSFGLVAYGYWAYEGDIYTERKIIGSGVLLGFLVVMPLFIWYRYKDKQLEDYIYDDSIFLDPVDEEE